MFRVDGNPNMYRSDLTMTDGGFEIVKETMKIIMKGIKEYLDKG